MNWILKRATLFAVLLFVLTIVLTEGLHAQQYVIREVMSGLVAPRGLAIGPDGGLYVTEAGSGGNGPSFVNGAGNETFLGATSGLSRLLDGVQERLLEGLPGMATAAGLEASGLNDIVFDSAGQAYGLFGLGGNPADRNSNLGTDGAVLGTIVRLPLDGGGTLQQVADIAGHELAANPDGTTVDSNPFKMVLTPSGDFLVADAGANAYTKATAAGDTATVTVLAPQTNPLFGTVGGPTYSAVPTAVAVGPDDAYYLGQLTGFPFPPGAANVYRFDPTTEELSTVYTNFTNIIDLTFDQEGNLYVLQITSNGLASSMGPGSGALIKIDPLTGERTTIASDGLLFPGGVVAAPDGTLYVSNRTSTPSGGQVLAISLVPEPSSLLSAFLGIGIVAFVSSRSTIRRSAKLTYR